MEEINRQLESNPLSEKHLISKARLLFDKQEYRSVIETLGPVLVRNPKSIDALEGTGKAYFQLEEYGRAIQFFNRLIELHPCYNYLYLRGACEIRIGLYDEAQRDNDLCLKLRACKGSAYVQRAEIHRRRFGLDEQCEKYMKKAIELSPNDPLVKLDWVRFSERYRQIRKKNSTESE
jgi:tetratricopeptide (TPR) repeat protein